MRLSIAWLVLTVGCGASVAQTTPTTDGASAEDSLVATVDSAAVDVEPEVAPPDIAAGAYLLSCVPSLAGGDHSLQFLFRVDLYDSGAFDLKMQALRDTATKYDNDQLVGIPQKVSGIPKDAGKISIRIPSVVIPGDAQPISDTEIVMTPFDLEVVARGDGSMCAEWNGQMVSPFTASFDGPGDFCVLRPWKEGALLPTASEGGRTYAGYPTSDFHCP